MTAQGVDVQLVLAGAGSCADDLQHRVYELGIGGSVCVLGVLPERDMPRLMSLLDIVVCPRRSLAVTELVSPLKPLEAFAGGRAVVMSDVAPQRDLAGADQSRALLFPAGDVERLTATLERLAGDRDLRARLGESGRRFVLDERRWATVTGPLVEAYTAARETTRRPRVRGWAGACRRSASAWSPTRFTTTGSGLQGSMPTVGLRPRRLASRSWPGWTPSSSSRHGRATAASGYRGVGRYSDAEFADLQALVGACRDAGIPHGCSSTMEDPVHTARFEPAALLCDVIMTVDA